jgi:hypothetical protein
LVALKAWSKDEGMPFNIKISSIVAVGACALSLLLGLVSGGSFIMVLIRALIFGAVFFVLIAGAQMLISQFLPELSNIEIALPAAPTQPEPGSVVDISVDDAGVSGAPDGGAISGAISDDNIAGASLDDLLSKIDMNKSENENENEEASEMTEEGELDKKETDGYTEDMNMEDEIQAEDKASEEPSSRNNRSIEEKEKNVGKYNPKDLASAISTMLKK